MRRRTFCGASIATLASAALPLGKLLAATTAATAADTPALTGAGRQIVLRASDIDDLRAGLRGTLLLSGQSGYEQARHIWNGAFDRRPALIARCAGAADVMRAVDFARTHELLTAVRGGGHSLSGQSVCDGGLMIDLSAMRSVRIDPLVRTARVEPGVLLGELDREAQAFGLVTPAGTVSHTGVAGLALGGGYGRLARKYGLTCDNLQAADVVTADGKLLHASEHENADLLWGLRGGGGNFGVVTSFEFRLHPCAAVLLGGPIVFPAAQAREVLRFYADFSHEPPDDVYADAILSSLPDGQRVLVIDTCYAGSIEAGERAFVPLRRLGKPLRDAIAPMPYVTLQRQNDETFAAGRRNYLKAGFLPRIEPELIDTLLGRFESANSPALVGIFAHIGGAAGRVAPTATAFWHRDARSTAVIAAVWSDAAQDEELINLARATFREAIEPHSRGFYVNLMAADDPQRRVDANYGGNLARLAALKAKHDPGNLFRLNANVAPRTSV